MEKNDIPKNMVIMMNKQELKKELSRSVNGAGMMTFSDVMRFLGRSKEYTRLFLKDMDSFGGERKGKLYFVGDVADKIIERTRMG